MFSEIGSGDLTTRAGTPLRADKLRIQEGQGIPRNFGYRRSCGE